MHLSLKRLFNEVATYFGSGVIQRRIINSAPFEESQAELQINSIFERIFLLRADFSLENTKVNAAVQIRFGFFLEKLSSIASKWNI